MTSNSLSPSAAITIRGYSIRDTREMAHESIPEWAPGGRKRASLLLNGPPPVNVSWHEEIGACGASFRVVCVACRASWKQEAGRWLFLERGGMRLPDLEGGIIYDMNRAFRCRCSWGDLRWGNLPRASEVQVQRALAFQWAEILKHGEAVRNSPQPAVKNLRAMFRDLMASKRAEEVS